MSFGNFIITMFIIYYFGHIVSVIVNKNKRVDIIKTNQRLEELRSKPLKTIEEQREFVNLRYPKTVFKFSWLGAGKFIVKLIIFIISFRLIYIVFDYYSITISIWHAILIIFILPIPFNMILKRFGIHKDDVTVFFRRKKK